MSEFCCFRTRPDTSCARSTTRRRRSGSSWCSRRIAATSSTIRGRTARSRSASTSPRRRWTRSSPAPCQHPVDGVIAVGDRPVVLAARAAAALDLPWHSVAGAQASHGQAALEGRADASPDCRAPHFALVPAHEMAGSAAAVMATVSLRAEARGPVGEPRRDPRQHARRIRRRVRSDPRAAGAAGSPRGPRRARRIRSSSRTTSTATSSRSKAS